jgi:hypothetical protein
VSTPAEHTAAEQPKPRRGWLVFWVLVVLLALGAFVGVLFYGGGLDAAKQFYAGYMRGSSASPTPSTASTSADATANLSPEALEAAKYVYAEQIESQVNLDKLADGQVSIVRVGTVDTQSDESLVNVTVVFKDGTSAPGALRFRRVGGVWYFETITGLRSGASGGSADTVQDATDAAEPVGADAKLAEVGVKEPDPGVLSTFAEQTKVNQPLFRDLMAGEYASYVVGVPVAGANTFTIPITMKGTAESTAGATMVLVAKTVEGEDRVFLTTFKKD